MAALLWCRYLTLISVLTSQKFIGRMMGLRRFFILFPVRKKDSGVAKGGIGLVINDASEGGSKGSLISSSEWTVKDVDSDSIDAVQVELSCSSGPLEISYVVSLYPLSMASAVIVKNNGRKDVTLTSAILSHLKFKKRAKAGIQGLRKCWYCTEPPLSSPFEVCISIGSIET
ncbi:APOSPORY-ASSOCIATED PROTEIN C-RELATED [Salix koriyanagi]|uniref:APOSPORY-ASSOCIATED PROTEIN C-RELATED n=1 Tax=Salix koriyanagi TaxID=2511006 RepID=A0A9Q1A7Y1_9ROSI|nr:APOSPORY-ASSOCIATED PROTEIN C-RELATED [Salix koriyanagi]